jgi:hypothetical protein
MHPVTLAVVAIAQRRLGLNSVSISTLDRAGLGDPRALLEPAHDTTRSHPNRSTLRVFSWSQQVIC